MAATRRIKKEIMELRELELKNFRNFRVRDDNVQLWHGLIVPDDPPYDKGAFKIEINFPVDYPFRPPKLHFHTKIYHPNIDEQGYMCLPIIMSDFWRPATRMTQVIMAVIALLSNPDPHYALRSDAAEELLKDRRKFMITAERHTIENALPRPKDRVPLPPKEEPPKEEPPKEEPPKDEAADSGPSNQENADGKVANQTSISSKKSDKSNKSDKSDKSDKSNKSDKTVESQPSQPTSDK